MLFVLSGPSTVGKSYCIEYLCHSFDFRTLTPYTTRQPRISESEGFHYHFRSIAELRALTGNLSIGYWARPLYDGQVYGYTDQVDQLAKDSRAWVIQAASDIALAIKKNHPTAVLVFLDFSDDDALRDRIVERYGTNGADVIACRMKHAEHERAAKPKYDHVAVSNSPEQLAREVLQIILSKAVALPQKARVPGPLADVDIRASLRDPDGLRIAGVSTDRLLERITGWSVDLTLAPRFYRVAHPFFLRRVFDLAQGSSADMLKRFRECVATEAQGVYLRPNEFVLASTIERLTVPPSMVCLVSGRSSYARMGVSVELSQIVLQPGHDDSIPLQIKNNMPYPIVVYPGVSIAQAVFFNTISASDSPYGARARAKYPAHSEDARSRYYLDPEYARLRETRPVRRRVDWDRVLHVLLLLTSGVTAASWFVTQLPDPMYAAIGRYMSISFFALTLLSLIAVIARLASRP